LKGKFIIKWFAREALYRSGVFGLYHRLRNRRALTVLMFHRVLPSDDPALAHADREFTFTLEGFQRVLDFVQRHYHPVSLQAVTDAMHGKRSLPARPLLITFDDGWRDTLTHAMPELQRRKLPALMFVASEAVCSQDEDRWWQDALVAVMARSHGKAALCCLAGLDESVARQPGAEQRLSAWMASQRPEQRRTLIDAVAPGEWQAVAHRQMLRAADVQSWRDAGLDVGGHGHSHAPLTLVGDAAEELDRSLAYLQGLTTAAPSMSFPHGAVSDALVDAARKAGFGLLFTSVPKLVVLRGEPSSTPETLGRIHVPENEWTCTEGRISPAMLATFLFARPIAQMPTHSRTGA